MQKSNGTLRGILEVGPMFIADFEDEYRLYSNTSPLEIQDNQDLQPIAIFSHDEQSLNILKLTAAIIARMRMQGFESVPDVFEGDVVTAADMLDSDPGSTGNVGTVSDNIELKLVGVDGREIVK